MRVIVGCALSIFLSTSWAHATAAENRKPSVEAKKSASARSSPKAQDDANLDYGKLVRAEIAKGNDPAPNATPKAPDLELIEAVGGPALAEIPAKPRRKAMVLPSHRTLKPLGEVVNHASGPNGMAMRPGNNRPVSRIKTIDPNMVLKADGEEAKN